MLFRSVLKDGSKLLEVMNLEEIEQVRKVSRAANNGPWVAWWSEMARKTVMRRLSKRLPMSTDIEEELFSRDETMRHAHPQPQMIEAEPSPPPMSRLDALEHHIDAGREEEAQAEEVIEEQAEELEAEIDSPDQAMAAELIAAIEAAADDEAVSTILRENQAHLIALPPELGAKIEVAADKRRKALAKEGANA